MASSRKTREQLERECEELRAQLEEAQETLRAIQEGEVDALVVSTGGTEQVFTLQGADHAYRTIVEQMNEGALTLNAEGQIRYANRRFAEVLGLPLERVLGAPMRQYVAEADRDRIDELICQAQRGSARGEVTLWNGNGRRVPAHLGLSAMVVNGVSAVCAVVTDLTEQRRAEQVLASERYVRAILNQAQDGIVVCDPEGRLTFVNAAARKLAQLDPAGTDVGFGQEVWGTRHYADGRPVPPEERPLARALRGETILGCELHMVRADGSDYDLLLSASPLRNSEGAILGAVATLGDITRRKAAEEQLQQQNEELRVLVEENQAIAEELRSQNEQMAIAQQELREQRQRYADLFQFAPDAYLGTDAQGTIQEANRAALKLLNASREGLMGQSLLQYVSEELKDDFRSQLLRLRQPGTHVEAEWVLKPRGRNAFHAAVTVANVTDESGGSGRCRWLIRDITERKRVEKALQESEERFRLMIDGASDYAIFTLDAEGRVASWNSSAQRLKGYNAEEILGQHFSRFCAPDDIQQELPQRHLKCALAEGSISVEGWRVRKDGSQFWASVAITALRDERGNLRGFAKIVRDITERKRAEEALRQLNGQLEQRVAERTAELAQAGEKARVERQRFLDVLDTLPVIVDILRPDGRIEWANRAYREALGDNVGKLCYASQFGRDKPCEECQAFRPLKTGQPHHWEWTLPNGRTFDIYNFPFADADGSPLILEMSLDITERRRAEAVLKDLNATLEQRVAERTAELERARAMLAEGERIAHVGTWQWHAETGQTLWSEEEFRIYGLEPAGQSPSYQDLMAKHIHPDDVAVNDRVLREVVRTHSMFESEHRIIRPDGAVRVLHNLAHPLFDPHGQLVAYIGATLDITDRKRAEDALRESEQRFRLMADAVPYGAWFADAAGNCTYVSPSFLELVGMSMEQVQRFGWMHLLPPEDVQPTQDHWLRCVKTGEDFEHEHRFRTKDNGWRNVLAVGRPIRDERGQITSWVGLNLDITERTRAEEALRRSEERLRQALGAAFAGIWDWDILSGQIVWSPENYELYGVAPTERVPGYSDWERNIHPADLPAANQAIRDTIDGRRPEYRAEFRVRHPQKGERWILGIGRVERAPNGRPLRMSGINIDITDRKLAEVELVSAKAALEHAATAKDRFIASLSHELRTPLTPVVAAIATLAADWRIPEDARQDLAMIERNIGLEVTLINDLLDVTRIANGKLVLNKQPIDAARILRDAAEICSADLVAKGQPLSIETPGAPYPVQGDSARLHQVFWNLIKNAVKFTPTAGSIAVTAAVSNGKVRIAVRDSGMGINPAILPKLFAAFEQGDRGQGFGGLGLGLAIAKGVVELHGGRIEAASEGYGKGATFTVELPLLVGCDPMLIAGATPPMATRPGQRSRGKSLRILLVEDHLDTARMMARLLEAEGHAVMRADSVRGALAALEGQEFDALMSDLGLPDGTGYDLMRQLLAANRKLPGIAVSGYGTPEDVQKSLDAGFSAHITKPVAFDALHQALVRIADRAGTPRRE